MKIFIIAMTGDIFFQIIKVFPDHDFTIQGVYYDASAKQKL